jgi:two-component system OmpR family sensor kinase
MTATQKVGLQEPGPQEPGPARWDRLHPGRWSLRTRVVASVSLVLVVLCAVITALSLLAASRFMVGRLDDQLVAAVDRSSRFAKEDPPDDGHPFSRSHNGQNDAAGGNGRSGQDDEPNRDDATEPFRGRGPLNAPGQAEGTLALLVENGRIVQAGVLDREGTIQPLDAADRRQLSALAPDGLPQSVDLDAGDYRVASSNGRTGSVIVTGLPLEPLHETVYQMALILTVVSLAALAAAFLVTRLAVVRALRPLRRVTETASHVAETPLDRGEVALAVRVPDPDPRTEVGQVGTALNRMLENVASALAARHESETKVRQFVADAGHELRTPLAALRGYAELTRRSRTTTPPEVVQSLERMESAAHRMSDIVTDLLLLAQLDAGRPLEQVSVDLTRVCLEGLDDARVAGPDHRWRLDLPAEPIEVTGDRLRLHQVVANLLTNARVHTPAGTTVTLALTREGSHATISVLDDGPGIPASILPTVFERFVRADSSRARSGADAGSSGGSTGLGLAIVSAVVEAHSGSIEVHSSPASTRFTLTLPALPFVVGNDRIEASAGQHR